MPTAIGGVMKYICRFTQTVPKAYLYCDSKKDLAVPECSSLALQLAIFISLLSQAIFLAYQPHLQSFGNSALRSGMSLLLLLSDNPEEL